MSYLRLRFRSCGRVCRRGRGVGYGAASLVWQTGKLPTKSQARFIRKPPIGVLTILTAYSSHLQRCWQNSLKGKYHWVFCSLLPTTHYRNSMKKHMGTRQISPSLRHLSSSLYWKYLTWCQLTKEKYSESRCSIMSRAKKALERQV